MSGAILVALLGCHGAISNPTTTPSSQSQPKAIAGPGTADTKPPTCTGTPSDYRTEVQPLVEHYCTSCHSPGGDAGEEHDFTQLELLRSQRRLVSARLRAHSMPPSTSAQPGESERELLIRWADCG